MEEGSGAVEDPLAEAIIVAEGRSPGVQDVVSSVGAVPEFFRSLDPVVDLLDQRLDHRTGNRKSLTAIRWVVHTRLVVLQVGDGPLDDRARIFVW